MSTIRIRFTVGLLGAVSMLPSMSACSGTARAGGVSSSQPIFIATDRGVEEIDTTGKVLRRISPTRARRPRLVPNGTMIFMATRIAELRRVNLDGTGERPIALIPSTVATECDAAFPTPWDPAALLRSDADMVVDKSGKAVCMHFTHGAEQGDNQISAWVRVDLGKFGRGELSLVCGVKPPGTPFLCDPPARHVSTSTAKGPFSITDSGLARRDDGKLVNVEKLDVGKLAEETNSSSGHWAIVSASIKKGKYRIRRLLILDRKRGSIYPIVPGQWPDPMDERAWTALKRGDDVTVAAATLSDVRALAHDDLFVIDSLLIVPGKRVVDTRAQLAY